MNDTVAALADLWAAVPIPSENWHRGLDSLRSVDADVRTALELVADDPAAAAALERLVESGASPASATGTGRLADATRLLEALPRPEGRHPYLDVIVPALDAAALLLEAVDASPVARAAFERTARDRAGTAGS